MDYLKKDRWRLSFSQRIGIFCLMLLIIVLELILTFQQTNEKITLAKVDKTYYLKLEKDLEKIINEQKSTTYFSSKNSFQSKNRLKDSLKKFDPNKLPLQGWEKLGFSTRQAEVIMKYKQMLGGKFESKEQIRKCFVVSDEMYELLSPYILLPEKAKGDLKIEKFQTKKTVNYKKFDPNEFLEKDWIAIGFSPKQAEVILKYKRILGGAFTSKEQLKKCFVISDEKYAQMEPYILLPDKEKIREKPIVKDEPKYEKDESSKKEIKKVEITEKFNPNNLDLEGWMNFGFTERQAQSILNYKRSLGGKFKDAKTLSKSYVISEEKFKEMEPFLIFD